jgi:elongation factor G
MGELHLEVLLNRMEREFKIQAHVGKPRVSYRETVLEPVEADGVFQRSLGNQRLHGEVTLLLEPEAGTRGVRMSHALKEGEVPREILPKLLESIRGSAEGAGAYGFPVTGVHARVLKARVLEGNDLLAALNAAANRALFHALAEARSAVLEPIMRMEVRTPEDYLGAVLKHLNARRALITESRSLPSHVHIQGSAPLAEMFGFSTELRSLSQGRASFNLEPQDYQPVPENQADQFVKRRLE